MLDSSWHWITNTPNGFVLILMAGFVVLASIYEMPTVIAWSHGCRKLWIVALINIFLGWTVIVWIVLLVWSLVCGEDSESKNF